jgi:hypothetical protein
VRKTPGRSASTSPTVPRHRRMKVRWSFCSRRRSPITSPWVLTPARRTITLKTLPPRFDDKGPELATAHGFSLHAGVACSPAERDILQRLTNLTRYHGILAPPRPGAPARHSRGRPRHSQARAPRHLVRAPPRDDLGPAAAAGIQHRRDLLRTLRRHRPHHRLHRKPRRDPPHPHSSGRPRLPRPRAAAAGSAQRLRRFTPPFIPSSVPDDRGRGSAVLLGGRRAKTSSLRGPDP